jgi:hypothetical protein
MARKKKFHSVHGLPANTTDEAVGDCDDSRALEYPVADWVLQIVIFDTSERLERAAVTESGGMSWLSTTSAGRAAAWTTVSVRNLRNVSSRSTMVAVVWPSSSSPAKS